MVVVRRRWFQTPWEFRESSLGAALIVVAGFILQYATSGQGVPPLHLPLNAVILVLFAVLTLGVGLGFRENRLVQWLGGIPLGLSLIVALALLSLIGGVIPQGEVAPGSLPALLGVNQIFSSWPFALTVLLFLVNLGLSLSWRLVPFSMKNIQFILFHAGFWIALSCGVFGSPDIQRLIMKVDEGGESNMAYSRESDSEQQLPFSVFLHDFSLEEYPPQLFLYDPRKNHALQELAKTTTLVHKGVKASWKGVAVEVLDFLPNALPGKNGIPEPADRTAGVAFAKVRITSTNAVPTYAWISSISPMMKPWAAPIGELLLVMAPGTPKAFRSDVTVRGESGQLVTATLEVNHPINVMGWKLYQMGYDDEAGRWSKYSLIEVIRDPWLPAVYLGFFMIMAGNVLFFWNGIKQKEVAS
ncbi:MAG: cytochrome c biogenesis protein [Chlorobium sp.]|nr:MAG: cytochrome c biogenesis protein [Chlorobium sp.]